MFQVPISGSEHQGEFYIWASRDTVESEWNIDRLEISVDDQPGKRILLQLDKDLEALSQ